MSLKAFHIFFICVSILLSAWFGIWCIRSFQSMGKTSDLLLGIGSLLSTVVLIFYFRWFLRKLKRESKL